MMKPISTVILLMSLPYRVRLPAGSISRPQARKNGLQTRPRLLVLTFLFGRRMPMKETQTCLRSLMRKPSSSTYGEVIATLPVGVRGTSPHHTEYEFPAVWPKPGWQWETPVGREEVG